jgi:hypothetical protein
MLHVVSYFIFMTPNIFGVTLFSLFVISFNRMPSSVLDGASPHSFLYSSSHPFALPLKVFGCVCYVHNLGPNYYKLDHRSTKCVFLGYSTIQKGYHCYSLALRPYFTSANVTFVESLSYFLVDASILEPGVTLFRCLFHIFLSLLCYLQAHLILSWFIHVDHAH